MKKKQLKEVRRQLLRITDDFENLNGLLRCQFINLCTLDRMHAEGAGCFTENDIRNYSSMVVDEFDRLLDSLGNTIDRLNQVRGGLDDGIPHEIWT